MSAPAIPHALHICPDCESEPVAEGMLCRDCRTRIERDMQMLRGVMESGERVLAMEQQWQDAQRASAIAAAAEANPGLPAPERSATRDWSLRSSAWIVLLAAGILSFAVWFAWEFCR